ncbi:MAG: AMP-binding protein [Micromonosporaceae bacterium]
MTYSVINRLVSAPPAAGHRISLVRLGGTDTLDLRELYRRSGQVAVWLTEQGVRPGDRIGILAANCLEWVLLDLAALRLKVVTAGFEPGRFEPGDNLLSRYGFKLFFTDRPWDAPGVVPIGDVGQAPDEAALPAVAYRPDEVTTLKFTSGSTGQPKGLAATVGSIDSSMRAVQQMFSHGAGDDLFVFLPLSLLQQRYWIYSALCFGHDVTVSTYQAAFGALGRTQPTVVMGVPAFFETARRHIQAQARDVPPDDRDGALRGAARRLFGDRIRYLWTGSAPASTAMLRFFGDVGLPIYEGYGLNETCIVSKNHPGAHRLGSVGQVLPGKQVLLDADGVISVRCEHPVNHRYAYAAPGESERIFGPDGVVRTGDLGHLDEDGFLYVRGRADDLLVLENGRKVLVRPIEEHLRESPAIEECVLVSPTRTHLVVVVSPAGRPADEAAIASRVAETNAVFAGEAHISRVVVATDRFSVENGLLTSQFKPKRARIEQTYRSRILGTPQLQEQ